MKKSIGKNLPSALVQDQDFLLANRSRWIRPNSMVEIHQNRPPVMAVLDKC